MFAGFIEDIPSFIDAFPPALLFFDRQLNKVKAFLTAGALHRLPALFTLDEQQVTSRIGTIDMRIARLTTLMALRNDIRADTFAQPVVKNEILPDKLIGQL